MILVFPLFFAASSAQAHEHRDVGGKYEWVVGFMNEPAFSGQMNGVDLRITRDGRPVEGAEKTLRAAVRKKDQDGRIELPLRTRYKQPGVYAGDFLPSEAGGYEFEIFGTLEGAAVHEVFKSGNGFGDVQDSEPLRFPKGK